MKSEVLKLLINLPRTPEEQFNKAFELYRKSSGKNPQSERFLNAAGFTAVNLENLLYDLKQLHGISDAQVRMAKAVKTVAKLTLTIEDLIDVTVETIAKFEAFFKQEGIEFTAIPEFSKGTLGNSERKAFIAENNLEAKGRTNKLMDEAIRDFIDAKNIAAASEYLTPKTAPVTAEVEVEIEVTATTKEEVFTTAPDDVKETVKLRDEFPFLNDTDCPEELYILVGKKFAHYDAYVKAHAALLVNVEDGNITEMTSEEIFALAIVAVENFEVNQEIYAELKHYAETKTILGTHPIFTERKLKSEIDLMTIQQATTRMSNLENYVRRDGKKLASKKTTSEEKEKLQKKITAWNFELSVIKAKLGFSDKK